MIVKDLIKRLRKLPRKAEVVFQPYPVMTDKVNFTISQCVKGGKEIWYVYVEPYIDDEKIIEEIK